VASETFSAALQAQPETNDKV